MTTAHNWSEISPIPLENRGVGNIADRVRLNCRCLDSGFLSNFPANNQPAPQFGEMSNRSDAIALQGAYLSIAVA